MGGEGEGGGGGGGGENAADREQALAAALGLGGVLGDLGLYPIVTSQDSSTALCQVSYHVQ